MRGPYLLESLGDTMKRILILTIVLAFGAFGVIMVAQQPGGTIEGIAKDSCEKVLSGVKVQLRNVDTGMLTESKRAGQDGRYSFTGIVPAAYVVEIVDDNGKTIGVSASIPVKAGAAITGIVPVGNLACAGGGGAFFLSTAGLLLLGAAAAATTAAVVVATNASPSR
jgi:hypothetical protein